jgi:hypothetical protein
MITLELEEKWTNTKKEEKDRQEQANVRVVSD